MFNLIEKGKQGRISQNTRYYYTPYMTKINKPEIIRCRECHITCTLLMGMKHGTATLKSTVLLASQVLHRLISLEETHIVHQENVPKCSQQHYVHQ